MNTAAPQKNICLNVFGLKIKLKNPWYRVQLAQYLKAQIACQNCYDLSEIRQAQKVVLFVLPAEEVVSGGILSIFSLCRYTRDILPNHAVVLVTEAGNKTYACISWFHTDEKIYRWEQMMDNLQNTERLILHIPEYMSAAFYDKLSESNRNILKRIPDLTINILNQNPQIMPPSDAVQNLFDLSPKVTQTLAFRDKNIQELANRYQMPITTVYSYLELSKWKPVPFNQKKKIILLSPDTNIYRKQVVNTLKKEMPDFKLISINKMSFEQYMSLVCQAFAVISFGEGYDGYLLQPIIVKTLSFAVYNETFFPNTDFLQLTNIYASYPEMIQNIAWDIRRQSNDPAEYYKAIRALKNLDTEHSEQRLITLLTQFYAQNYECNPE